MRQVFEAFRLACDKGRSQRDIGRALRLTQSTVNPYLCRFRTPGLPWPVPPEVDRRMPQRVAVARDAHGRGMGLQERGHEGAVLKSRAG